MDVGGPQPCFCSVPLGESPPPPPRACFGRDELVDKLVSFAEILEPIALIGAGGIGKISIALAALHHNRIKDRFANRTPLRPHVSSHEIFPVLDNAETILDPQGTDAQGIYAVVDELSRFKTICHLITSRITTVPRHCKRPVIPTLSKQATCAIFYSVYGEGEPSDTINDLLQRLDFHALSITLLATVASHNMWYYDKLAK